MRRRHHRGRGKFRSRVHKGKDRRAFSRHSKTHRRNMHVTPMRGGFRI